MNLQAYIVGMIVFFAVLYVGKLMRAKAQSFSTKSACGVNCGCGEKSNDKLLTQIGKS